MTELKGRTVLVTGASGLIGKAVVEALLAADAKVVAAGRSLARLRARLGERPGLTFLLYDATRANVLDVEVDGLVLAASPAVPDQFLAHPEDVTRANTAAVSEALAYAAKRKGTRVVYVSSSEVYGRLRAPETGHTEDRLGELDVANPRSVYAAAKRAGEELCRAAAADGVEVAIVRPGHVYGPTATVADGRVSSLWPREAAAGRPIVMKSDGRQRRSYVYGADCASAILTVLLRGKPGVAYNISNRRSVVTIRELAETIGREAHVAIKMDVPTSAECAAFNPMDNSTLDSTRLESLDWCPVYDLPTGIRLTLAALRVVPLPALSLSRRSHPLIRLYFRVKRWLLTFAWSWPLRMRYRRQLKRLQTEYGRRPLRVAFLVGTAAKWKMQSLFEALAASPNYAPFLVLTAMDVAVGAEVREEFRRLREWCTVRQMPVVAAYDPETGVFTPPSAFAPDIVFYQEPWNLSAEQDPRAVSRYALTCYVPYFVQNYGDLGMDCDRPFHRYLWRHFTLNAAWAKVFNEHQGMARAGQVVGIGHPMLDAWADATMEEEPHYVIYAPHWSCGVGECYSTFETLGRPMLEFAQRHPEIKWVFKPHPTLRHTLLSEGIWRAEEIDAYYAAWERMGVACYDGDYMKYFRKSKALVTDCASFLVEFACTGRPIIHLRSPHVRIQPHPIARALFDTYYQAQTIDELTSLLELVVLKGEDPYREKRVQKVGEMSLTGHAAAPAIVQYLDDSFIVRDSGVGGNSRPSFRLNLPKSDTLCH